MGLKLFRTTGHSSLLDTRSALAWQTRSTPSGGNPLILVLVVSAWLATVGNWPLWQALARAGQLSTASGYAFALALAVVIFATVGIISAFWAWRHSVKPALYVLLIIAALGSHWLAQGIALDASVVSSLRAKPGVFFSLGLPLNLLIVAGVPILWLARQPLRALSWTQQGLRNVSFGLFCLGLAVVALGLSAQRIDSALGGPAKLRAMVNPLGTISALVQLAASKP